ncbi:MAG: MBL fold metallo-hydrolase RNA specificity domain-containing protein, partial [Bdellovibrionota bacterium]
RAILEICETRGHLIIPSFSVGRAQELLLLIHRLRESSRIPTVPVYLDSPMAIEATAIFSGCADWHKLAAGELNGINTVATRVRSRTQSRELLSHPGPCIIIAGSGMVTGGRVLHHLFHRLPDPSNRVLLAGFQAAGTRGAALVAGAPDVKIHGVFVPVRAAVRVLENLSAHADQGELQRWIARIAAPAPRRVFITHGEMQAAEALKLKLSPHLDCIIPEALSEHAAIPL